MNLSEMYDYLVDNFIANSNEIDLVVAINGWNEETMTDILYARLGYRSFDQLAE